MTVLLLVGAACFHGALALGVVLATGVLQISGLLFWMHAFPFQCWFIMVLLSGRREGIPVSPLLARKCIFGAGYPPYVFLQGRLYSAGHYMNCGGMFRAFLYVGFHFVPLVSSWRCLPWDRSVAGWERIFTIDIFLTPLFFPGGGVRVLLLSPWSLG